MDIKTLMRARFVPPSYRKELILKLQRLHQGPRSVSEYFKELKSQMRRVEIKETNKEKIRRFVSGLRRDIKYQVELPFKSSLENKNGLTKARGNTLRKDGTRAHKREAQILPQIKSSSIKGLKNLWSNSLQGEEDDEGLTSTKDGGICLRRLNMFRKEVH